MKTLVGMVFTALFALTMLPRSGEAAAPKDGRYKGTMTFRVQVEGNTKAEVKKVLPMAGVLTGGTMVAVMTEVPPVPSLFQKQIFNVAVADGSVQIRAASGNYFFLGPVRTTATAIKGSSDLGITGAIGGSGAGRYLIDVTLTRVGN